MNSAKDLDVVSAVLKHKDVVNAFKYIANREVA